MDLSRCIFLNGKGHSSVPTIRFTFNIKSGVLVSLFKALHLAASEGHIKAVQYLIEQGADANAKDRWGFTPYGEAEANKHQEVQLLILYNLLRCFTSGSLS